MTKKKVSKSRRRRSRARSREIFPKKKNLYCGNNRLANDLVNGNAIIGTRFQCLRKGYGAGYNSPIDPNFTTDYEPIDNRKIYCGDKQNLPNGYDLMGNSPICLRKGYGVGYNKKQREHI